MATPKNNTVLFIVGGIIIVAIIIAIIYFVTKPKAHTANKELTLSGTEIKDTVKKAMRGNNVQINDKQLDCVVDTIENTELNVSDQTFLAILKEGGIDPAKYKDGLMSSVNILSNALDAKKCYIYKFDSDTLNKIVDTTIYSVGKILDKMKVYTGFAFVSTYQLIENCTKAQLDDLLNKSGNIKKFYNLLQQCKNEDSKPKNPIITPPPVTTPYGPITLPPGTTIYFPGTTPYGPGTTPYGPGTTPYGPGTTPYGPSTTPYGPSTTPYGPSTTLVPTTTPYITTTPAPPVNDKAFVTWLVTDKLGPYVKIKMRDLIITQVSKFYADVVKLKPLINIALSMAINFVNDKLLDLLLKMPGMSLDKLGKMLFSSEQKTIITNPDGTTTEIYDFANIQKMIETSGSFTAIIDGMVGECLKHLIQDISIPYLKTKLIDPAIKGLLDLVAKLLKFVGLDITKTDSTFGSLWVNMVIPKIDGLITSLLKTMGAKVESFIMGIYKTARDKLKTILTKLTTDPLGFIKSVKDFNWILMSKKLYNSAIDAVISAFVSFSKTKAGKMIGLDDKETSDYVINGLKGFKMKETFLLLASTENYKYLRPYVNTTEYFMVFDE